MNIVLLGPPGAGKGTQARLLSERLKIPHISTGDILRAAREAKTVLGQRAERYMKEGQLVPDELVVDLVKKRLDEPDCRPGFVLDGFPRNLFQAKSLKQKMTLLSLEVDENELVRRISGRRQCAQCGQNFQIHFQPPREAGKCDRCGGILRQRDDDREEIVLERLRVYEKETAPLLDYYRDLGQMITVRGTGDVQEIFRSLVQGLSR
ncbi:MAG: adenylate kinase [Deltaproteobacteria bacterium]|nr:adenylate kinase [Deltaproteobacteria bacterium]MBI4374185.1 adenylate kinase [Deltaproteobacteria bacterium]